MRKIAKDVWLGLLALGFSVAITVAADAAAQLPDDGEGGGGCEECPGRTTPTCCTIMECIERDQDDRCVKIQTYYYYFAP